MHYDDYGDAMRLVGGDDESPDEDVVGSLLFLFR